MDKIFKFAILSAFFLFPMNVYANDLLSYSIEDKDLTPVPESIDKAIRQVEADKFSECKFIGKKITGTSNDTLYFATTADVCNWGAYLGPIWVVENDRVLVKEASYLVEVVGDDYYPDFKISGGSAGHSWLSIWSASENNEYQIKERQYFKADCQSENKNHPDFPFKCE